MQASWTPPFPGLPVSDMWFQEKPLSGFALASWPVKLSTDFTGSVELPSEILVSLSTEQMCSDQECDYQHPPGCCAHSLLMKQQRVLGWRTLATLRRTHLEAPGEVSAGMLSSGVLRGPGGPNAGAAITSQERRKCFVRQLLYFIELNYITPFCVSQ